MRLGLRKVIKVPTSKDIPNGDADWKAKINGRAIKSSEEGSGLVGGTDDL